MEKTFSITDKIHAWMGDYAIFGNFTIFLIVLLIAYIFYVITKKITLKVAGKLIRKTKSQIDDHLLYSGVFERLALFIPVIIIYNSVFLFPDWAGIIDKIVGVSIAFLISISLTALLNGLNSYYSTLEISKIRPVKGYVQVINLIIYLVTIIFIIGFITGRSPWELLAGLGALTAVLLLIFRDTILSFVASLQIAGNDLVHVGDWIEMPKYGADGDVIDIALHTIKVQNWDKTITIIPTYKLIEESFKNWRGMQASGGRRIKRSIFIDLNTIQFCTDEQIDRFEKINLISEYIKSKKEELGSFENHNGMEIINNRHLTNIGTFRKYIENYVKSHPRVHKDMTCMVRQLAPGANGLPLEIYLFINDTAWVSFESIQSDIFDHILAVVPQFDLRVYQQPSGQDMSRIQFMPSAIQ